MGAIVLTLFGGLFSAIDAAIEIQQVLAGTTTLKTRIGINTGTVVGLTIGTDNRLNYTLLGDAVNVASRLEGINKEFQTQLCISHAVFKEAGERLCVRPIDDVVVKGRRAKVPIYELMGVYGSDDPTLEPSAEAVRLSKMTRHAYEALAEENVALAIERYREILAEFPADPVATALVRRLQTV